MSKEFFCVAFDYGDDFYFHSWELAKEFLWVTYLERCPYETEAENLMAMDELQTENAIQSIGIIYTYEFED